MSQFHVELCKAIKYLTEKKEDFYPSLVGEELTPHFMFADFLREHGDEELADRVHKQALLTQQGARLVPVQRHTENLHDAVLSAVRTGHPNPTVRALAAHHAVKADYSVSDLLFHSPYPHDRDLAVFFAMPDPINRHTHSDVLNRIDSHTGPASPFNHGLSTKTVKGTTYLLDENVPTEQKAFGAPHILLTAPSNDRDRLTQLAEHAEELAAQRHAEQQHFGDAQVGPTQFTAVKEVLKYALLPNAEVAPFTKSKQGSKDTHTDLVLADRLGDAGDPREDIIRRHLGYTSHPQPELYNESSSPPVLLSDRPEPYFVEFSEGVDAHPNGISYLSFYPVRWANSKLTSPAGAVRAQFSHFVGDGAGRKSLHYEAHFTPEEARGLADKLPDEHAVQLHLLLDRFFGKRS